MIGILEAVADLLQAKAKDCIWEDERDTFQDASDALHDAIDLIRELEN